MGGGDKFFKWKEPTLARHPKRATATMATKMGSVDSKDQRGRGVGGCASERERKSERERERERAPNGEVEDEMKDEFGTVSLATLPSLVARYPPGKRDTRHKTPCLRHPQQGGENSAMENFGEA